MSLTDLIPWSRSRALPALRNGDDADPFFALHREMNRLFDDFTRGFPTLGTPRTGWVSAWPTVDVTETDDQVLVTAELPGLEEKDIDITLQDGVLTLKGEKKSETKQALYSERWHGRFQRSLEVGAAIDPDQVSASFKNGVLTITLAKRPDAANPVKRIPIAKG